MAGSFKMAQPMIPPGMMHVMYEVVTSGSYDQSKGGQWASNPAERVPFDGVVLPVSDKDLAREITGTVANVSEKIYTNGHALKVGARVYDPESSTTYTVTQELGHNSLHPLKRYLVEARGGAAPR